jgi:hypothetical protein
MRNEIEQLKLVVAELTLNNYIMTYYPINHGAVAFQPINAKQLLDWL